MTRKLQILVTITLQEEIDHEQKAELIADLNKVIENTLLYDELPVIEQAELNDYLVEEFIQP